MRYINLKSISNLKFISYITNFRFRFTYSLTQYLLTQEHIRN